MIPPLGILLDSDDVVSSGCAADVLKTTRLASKKPGFVDRPIHNGYLRGAVRVATFEKAARKLGRTLVLKP